MTFASPAPRGNPESGSRGPSTATTATQKMARKRNTITPDITEATVFFEGLRKTEGDR